MPRRSLRFLLLPALVACTDGDDPSADDRDSGETDPPASHGLRVTALPVRTCEVGTAWRDDPLPAPPGDEGMPRNLIGAAVAVLDLDGDDRRDVLIAGPEGVSVARGTEEGLVSEPAWVEGLDLVDVTSLAVVDLDADGVDDVLVTRWRRAPLLLRSLGQPPLVDVTPPSLAAAVGPWMGSALGDLDGDGDLDLFLASYAEIPEGPGTPREQTEPGEPSMLLVQEDGVWTDQSSELPPQVQQAFVFGAFWLDLDVDGRADLLTVHDYGWSRPSQLLWSREEGLVRDDGSTGWAIPFAGMGVGVGDLDGDGEPDVVQSSWEDTSLLVREQGTWYEEAVARGLRTDPTPPVQQEFGWGTTFVDLERDGDLDIPMGFGHWDDWGGSEEQSDAVFVQEDGVFVDRAPELGLDRRGPTRGLVATDLEGDGAVDLVTRRLREGAVVHRAPCPEGAWLTVRLQQDGPNRAGVGARVRAFVGDRAHAGWVLAGTHGLHGSVPPEVDFGLGDVERIDRLEVRWPDGTTGWITDVPVPARLIVERTD